MLEEVYIALHADSRRLAAMGARTVVDMFVLDKIGDVGTFPEKLNALVENKYLVEQQRDTLNAALKAGHAAAHRGYNPIPEVLNHVMDIVESLLQFYPLEQAGKVILAAVPPRSKGAKAKQ